MEYDVFLRTFLESLDKHAPMKNKVIGGKPCQFYD